MSRTVAIVVAAGRGKRFGGDVPKQYQMLGSIPVLRHAVCAFLDHDAIDAVLPVLHEGDREMWRSALDGLTTLDPVLGGETRQSSVLNGLEAIEGTADRVLIHDGARPNLAPEIIDRVCAALDDADGAVPVLAIADTLKRGNANQISETVDRQGLFRAQTPQGFRLEPFLKAHREMRGQDLTDDAAVAEAAGLRVMSVQGDEDNIKVTKPDDIQRLARLMPQTAALVRVGTGFDIHRFGPGTFVTLCGVRIPHERGLIGHSDADAALHAVTDAILGGLSLGDIGEHFPPDDAKWANAASGQFVQFAAAQVQARAGQIQHVDVTIICEVPKIAPHRAEMCQQLASLLGLRLDQVSVKATTSEGLGFVGRKEGIAVQASVTLGIPPRG